MLIESQNNVENRNAELLEILGGNIFIRNVLYAVALGKPASDYYLHKIYQAITATCFIMSLSFSLCLVQFLSLPEKYYANYLWKLGSPANSLCGCCLSIIR